MSAKLIPSILCRRCNSCEKSIYLGDKETYVSIKPNKLLKRILPFMLETKFYCKECDRNFKINKLVK
jgi:hypothetical protein